MRFVFGHKVLTRGRTAVIRRGGNKLPERGERQFFVELPRGLLLIRWRVREGYRAVGLYERDKRFPVRIEDLSYWVPNMAMRRRQTDGDPPPIPALSAETTLLKKHPLIMEWVTATAYDDGAMRQPGYYTMRNRLVEFEMTFYDPDAGLRLPVRHREHDKCWALAEQLLAAPDAPWEVDKYLWEHKPKEKKKKK